MGGKFNGIHISKANKNGQKDILNKKDDNISQSKTEGKTAPFLSKESKEKIMSIFEKSQQAYQKTKVLYSEYMRNRGNMLLFSKYSDSVKENNLATREYNTALREEAVALSVKIGEKIKSYQAKTEEIKAALSKIKGDSASFEDKKKKFTELASKISDIIYNKKEATLEEKINLRKEYDEAFRDYYEAKLNSKQKAEESISKQVSDILKKNYHSTFKVQAVKITPSVKGAFQHAKAALDGCLDETLKLTDLRIQGKKGRASAGRGNIYLQKSDTLGTMIHEYAHYLEENNPKMLLNSLAFLSYRTQGEREMKLKSMTGLNYRSNEVAKADKFFSPYCGKIYSHAASEIMSMGMQRLFTDPSKFAEEDREYFDFVIANMRGEL